MPRGFREMAGGLPAGCNQRRQCNGAWLAASYHTMRVVVSEIVD